MYHQRSCRAKGNGVLSQSEKRCFGEAGDIRILESGPMDGGIADIELIQKPTGRVPWLL